MYEITYIVVCRRCGSRRIQNVLCWKLTLRQTLRYKCACCGEKFDVSDFDDYTSQHPPGAHRCGACDGKPQCMLET